MILPSRIRRFAWHVSRGTGAIALVTAICCRVDLNTASTGLLLLVTVFLLSLDSTFPESASVSILAVLSLDYFFTEPKFSITVSDPADVITLCCLLATSITVVRLQSKIRAEAAESKMARESALRLHKLGEDLLALPLGSEFGVPGLEAVMRNFSFETVAAFDARSVDCLYAGKASPGLESKIRSSYLEGSDHDEPGAAIVIRCLRVRNSLIGAAGFIGGQCPVSLIDSIAAAIASALERTRIHRVATQAYAQAQAETLRAGILDALAHEIKTPLAAIMTAAGGIRMQSVDAPGNLDLSELIENEAARIATLTSRILQVARLDSQDIKPHLEPVRPGELAGTLVDRYTELYPERQFSLLDSGSSLDLSADRNLLSLALSQLLENACRYSKPDAQVSIEVDSDASGTRFTVLNEGMPIPAHEKGRIFERFYRGERARADMSGSGLGLYIARRVALAHGGNITLIDAGPEAVAFRLTVPFAPAEVPAAK